MEGGAHHFPLERRPSCLDFGVGSTAQGLAKGVAEALGIGKVGGMEARVNSILVPIGGSRHGEDPSLSLLSNENWSE